jgi:hypothetical protein
MLKDAIEAQLIHTHQKHYFQGVENNRGKCKLCQTHNLIKYKTTTHDAALCSEPLFESVWPPTTENKRGIL